MSLALVQGYSSEEEEVPRGSPPSPAAAWVCGEEQAEDEQAEEPPSSLLSPLDAFAEITGPPAFLKHCAREQDDAPRPKRVDAVFEAKPVSLPHNRPSSHSQEDVANDGSPRVIKPGNPSVQDAAELLRMCVQCGVPKTFSEATGMVCPVCRDHPRKEIEVEKKRSKVKDREKNKRSKGQSSHATWKSETEMHLRQQFD